MLRQEKLILVFKKQSDFKAMILPFEEILIKKYEKSHVTEISNKLHLNLMKFKGMLVA